MLYNIMVFAVPCYIIQPSTDDTVQIVPLTAEADFQVTCSLNVIIPVGMIVTWLHNGDVIFTVTIKAATTNTVHVRRKERSPAGVYQCTFNYTTGYSVRRKITVLGMCDIIHINYIAS